MTRETPADPFAGAPDFRCQHGAGGGGSEEAAGLTVPVFYIVTLRQDEVVLVGEVTPGGTPSREGASVL